MYSDSDGLCVVVKFLCDVHTCIMFPVLPWSLLGLNIDLSWSWGRALSRNSNSLGMRLGVKSLSFGNEYTLIFANHIVLRFSRENIVDSVSEYLQKTINWSASESKLIGTKTGEGFSCLERETRCFCWNMSHTRSGAVVWVCGSWGSSPSGEELLDSKRSAWKQGAD